MLDFSNVYEGTEVLRIQDGTVGVVLEIGERRPVRVRVKWSDGTESWMHPEQVRIPSALRPPPEAKLTSFKRTTPQYLVNLRRRGWAENAKNPAPAKPNLEKEADRLVETVSRRRSKSQRKADKHIRDFQKREFKHRQWISERIARDKN
jgi:hypothetical protein